MTYLKRIITAVIVMAIYIGCVMWIYEGIKLEPADKFVICWFGACSLFLSQLIVVIIESPK